MPIRSGCGYVRVCSISGADSGEPISKQGSSLVRWSAVEAVSRYHGGAEIRDLYTWVAGAATSAGSPPPESFSPSSTTGSETERSDASETRRETVRARSDCELEVSADPTLGAGRCM
jgi:hypothetical protein